MNESRSKGASRKSAGALQGGRESKNDRTTSPVVAQGAHSCFGRNPIGIWSFPAQWKNCRRPGGRCTGRCRFPGPQSTRRRESSETIFPKFRAGHSPGAPCGQRVRCGQRRAVRRSRSTRRARARARTARSRRPGGSTLRGSARSVRARLQSCQKVVMKNDGALAPGQATSHTLSNSVYTAMPTTASAPNASSASTSCWLRMPPATMSCFFVSLRSRSATSAGNPRMVPSVSTCV